MLQKYKIPPPAKFCIGIFVQCANKRIFRTRIFGCLDNCCIFAMSKTSGQVKNAQQYTCGLFLYLFNRCNICAYPVRNRNVSKSSTGL